MLKAQFMKRCDMNIERMYIIVVKQLWFHHSPQAIEIPTELSDKTLDTALLSIVRINTMPVDALTF